MKTALKTLTLLAALVPSFGALAADGLTIEHLTPNSTMVRVATDSVRYLLLPVEESSDDARVNVLVNGNTARTFYVRLAKNKVDYFVPFDITPYRNTNLSLTVNTSQDRTSVREAKDDVCWTDMTLSDSFDSANREKYRPSFHHTPLWGWMNDPNGMVYHDGVWHLYYQYNPYGSKWQNMTWGHSSSTDLVNWKHHPLAIEPNGLGTVFSGSCVIDSAGTAGMGKEAIIALYTSAGDAQMQSLASSTDGGESFEIFAGNPVITLESEARDPNMFWDARQNRWVLTLAHALDHEMLFFTSPDLKEWTLQSAFGRGEGCQDGVWECPDLFRLPVEGSDEQRWVLICNINPGGPFGGSATQYFTGDFDGKTFRADTDSSGKIPTKWMDYGKDNYATVSFSDVPSGRRTVLGWMSNWQYAAEVPTRQFRSANTLPRDLSLFRGADSLLYLKSAPSPELLSLRDKKITDVRSRSINRKAVSYPLPSANGGICEILATIDPVKASEVTLTLKNDDGEKVDIVYDVTARTLSFDRRKSGVTDFSRDFPAVTTAPTFSSSRRITLRIFIDRSSIEVFGDDGRFVMTNLVFPTNPYSSLNLSATGGQAKISNLSIYSLVSK